MSLPAIIVLILIAGITGFLIYASSSIRSGVYLKAYCKAGTKEKKVALTFDDGPDKTITPAILDILKAYQVRAAFFCVGLKAEQHTDIIRRIQEEGHLIGNHSYSHTASFPFYSKSRIEIELITTDNVLEKVTGEPIRFFRPPFGVTNPTIAKAVKSKGYSTIGWSIRSLDTRGEISDKVFSRIISNLSAGDVILLHDRMPNTPETVKKLLDYLQTNDYKIVRVDELFQL